MHRLPRSLTLRHQHPHTFRRRRPFNLSRTTQQRWQSQMQTLYRSNGEAVRYQAVRFKRPGLSLRRLATIGLYTGVVYGYLALLWRQMDVEIEFVEDDEEEEQHASHPQQQQQQRRHPGDEDDGDENAEDEMMEGGGGSSTLYADEESTFIPLTWSKKMPRTYYRGSDPEWQEFIRIAKDPPRHKKIQDELVQIVFAGSAQHPSISRQLGQNTKVGKYWLDISFPDGPPAEYERRGIEIGDGYVAWSTQKIDADKQWRTERALMPRAAAEGVWRTAKVLAGIQWRRMKQRLGLEEIDPLSPEERFRTALSEMQQREDKAGREVQTEAGASVVASGAATSPTAQPARTNAQAEKKGDLPWHIPTIPLPSSSAAAASTAADLPIAMHVFSATLSKSWNPKKVEPPRGTFVVQGLVEVRGSRGRIMFDVQSCYDPRQNKFVHVNAGVRGYKRWRQSPKGGP